MMGKIDLTEVPAEGTVFHIHLYITSSFLKKHLTDQQAKKLAKHILERIK